MKTDIENALDRFQVLEERIAGVLDALRKTRQEKQAAERELMAAESRIRRLEQENAELRDERGRIRQRVEALISALAALESEKEDSIA